MKNRRALIKLSLKKKLTKEEIETIVSDYTNDLIREYEMKSFLRLVCKRGLSFKETVYLTEAMINSGDVIVLDLKNKQAVDKHSTGGVGDKVSLIVGPIVAATGIVFPKMSGKGLGFTGGTVDKLSSIPGYQINLSGKKFLEQLHTVGMSIIKQTKNLVPADKKIYDLRNKTNYVNNNALIASSIMSKKIASGADKIVIDLKVGTGAFMSNVKEATALAKLMIKIGKYFNREVVCILTDMNVPLGRNVGNKLEVLEAIEYFDGKKDRRLDWVVKYIAVYMVSIGKNISIKEAKKQVFEVIENGKAKKKFYEWISAQGGKVDELTVKSKTLSIVAKESGYIKTIDAKKIGELIKSAGAGRVNAEDKIDTNVGIVFEKEPFSKVMVGDVLATVYYNKEIKDLESKVLDCYTFSKKKVKVSPVVIKVID